MDLAEKLENAESKLNSYGGFGMLSNAPAKDKKEESQLSKLTKDGFVFIFFILSFFILFYFIYCLFHD